MLPDALPQLINSVLRLHLLNAAQLRELIHQLPDSEAYAQEMLRRGWITQDQYSSLFPGRQQPPMPRETMLLGSGDNETPPDGGGEDWLLPVDEEDLANVPPEDAWALPDDTAEEMRPEPVTVEAVVADGNEARQRGGDTGRRPRRWIGRASIGLLIVTLLLGGFVAAMPLFETNSPVPPVAP